MLAVSWSSLTWIDRQDGDIRMRGGLCVKQTPALHSQLSDPGLMIMSHDHECISVIPKAYLRRD